MGVFDFLRSLRTWLNKPVNQGPAVEPSQRRKRNAPCYCGSGLKYKKCHRASDQEQADVERMKARLTFSNQQFESGSYSKSAVAQRGFSKLPEISENLKKMQKDES